MAIALQPKYPIPDRSDQSPQFVRDEDGCLDIGWCDGVMTDGRPFRAEMWAQEGVSMLTIFFSTKDLSDLDDARILNLVVDEGLVAFRTRADAFCEARRFINHAGQELWSVGIVVGDDENSFLTGSVPTFPYSKAGGPNTMFNPVGMKSGH
jgi:hypothetical protein